MDPSTYIISMHNTLIPIKSKCPQYIHPPIQNDLPLRLAIISDWGPIITKPYKPLNDTLDYILSQRKYEK